MNEIRRVAFAGRDGRISEAWCRDLEATYDARLFSVPAGTSAEAQVQAALGELVQFAPDITVMVGSDCAELMPIPGLGGRKIGLLTAPCPTQLGGALAFDKTSVEGLRITTAAVQNGFDVLFHCDETSRRFLEIMGLRLSGYRALPVAARIEDVPLREREWDIVFIGPATGRHSDTLDLLKGQASLRHIPHRVSEDEALAAYRASRIALAMRYEAEVPWLPEVPRALRSGCLVLAESLPAASRLVAGQHYLAFETLAELREGCVAQLADPHAGETVRRAGRDFIERDLAPRSYFARLFEECAAGAHRPPACDLARLRTAPFEICSTYGGFEHLLDEFRGADA